MKPRLFVGSSVEGLDLAKALQHGLQHEAKVSVWHQGVIPVGTYTASELLRKVHESDFGAFVLTPDDILKMRGGEYSTARDNVIWELGLFTGHLGQGRVFMVIPREHAGFHLPSDLLGITAAHYDSEEARRKQTPLQEVLGPACFELQTVIRALGTFDHISFSHYHPALEAIPTPSGAPSLAGLWLSRFEYEESRPGGTQHGIQYDLEYLTEVGTRSFVGENLMWSSSLGRGYLHTLSVERFGATLIGAWVNKNSHNAGALQLLIDNLGTRMQGEHLGNANDNTIRHGSWRWVRVSAPDVLHPAQIENFKKRPLASVATLDLSFSSWFDSGKQISLIDIGLV